MLVYTLSELKYFSLNFKIILKDEFKIFITLSIATLVISILFLIVNPLFASNNVAMPFTIKAIVVLVFISYIISILMILMKQINQNTKRDISEKIFKFLTSLAAISVVTLVAYLLTHIFMLGKDYITFEFLFTAPKQGLTEGGIFPAIIGTAL